MKRREFLKNSLCLPAGFFVGINSEKDYSFTDKAVLEYEGYRYKNGHQEICLCEVKSDGKYEEWEEQVNLKKFKYICSDDMVIGHLSKVTLPTKGGALLYLNGKKYHVTIFSTNTHFINGKSLYDYRILGIDINLYTY